MDEDGLLTALPRGRDPETGRLRVTAFVTARVDVTGDVPPVPLSTCPTFSDWGAISGQVRLALVYQSGVATGTIALQPDPSAPRPDGQLWRTLFDDVHVGSGTFQDLSDQTVASFPAQAVSELIRTTYALVAEQSPGVFPPTTTGPLVGLRAIGDRLRRRELGPAAEQPSAGLPRFASPRPGGPPGAPGRHVDRSTLQPPTSVTGGYQTLVEAQRFYDRPGAADPLGPDRVPDPPKRPHLEFHAFVSAMADYPELLRHLGLAMDFLLAEELPGEVGQIRFEPVELPVDWARAEVSRPWTSYEIRGRRFIARPRSDEDELVDGSLRVESDRLFHLEQIDVDGGALKLAGTAASVAVTAEVVSKLPGSETVAPSMTPDASSLPALRGMGLTLYRNGRAEKIVRTWDAAKKLDDSRVGGNVPELTAEDVTRGYRIDVAMESEPDTWYTLHARTGTYLLRTGIPGEREPLPLAEPIGPDEGYVKAASLTKNVAEPKVAYLHEAVAGWEGWSLSAPRPGNRIGLLEVEGPTAPGDEPDGFELPLEVSFRPTAGSLPALRFGRSYRMRSRLVDMAGGSVSVDDLDPRHVTPFTPFRRWDPVPPPTLIPRRPFTEGESLLRMVIRSTLGVPAADYVALGRIRALPGHERDDLQYRAMNDRHLAAPAGSQQLAEMHGQFDAAVRQSSSTAERDAAFDVATRSAGSFLSPADAGVITDGKAPPRPVVLNEQNLLADSRTGNLGEGEYVLHDVDLLTLPYLPDPLAVAASFTALPGTAGTWELTWPGHATWFDRRPILLRIEDGSGPPDWDENTRVLRVFLRPAEQVRVAMSSILPKDALPLMGVWMLERPAAQAAQEADAVSGRHWMLTPWATLELVHAVEKPIAAPVVNVSEPAVYNSGVFRYPGNTHAWLAGTIGNHAKSTGRLDVDAAWTEPIDDVTSPSWFVRHGQSHVVDFLLEATEDACRIGSKNLAPTLGRPATHEVRHEFGDTKHRWVEYTPMATTRFREYFPTAITADKTLIRHVGPKRRLSIPSSHRPDPAQVAYVVPTWSWDDHLGVGIEGPLMPNLGVTQIRTRVGGGLRVYLARPWFSSGEDELLGVVIRSQPWLTAPPDLDADVLAAGGAQLSADLAAQRILDAGLVDDTASSGLGPAARLLAGVTPAPVQRPIGLGADVDLAQAQLASHLAVLGGVRRNTDTRGLAERNRFLTAVLDELAAGADLGTGELIDGVLGASGPLTSKWGSDPAWSSERTPRGPYIHQFPLRTAVGTDMSIPGQEKHAVVVGHPVQFDATRGLWFCDIQLDVGGAYQPFVDLALVRYQPYSVAGYHCSSVVKPGFIQVLPDRTAAVTRSTDRTLLVSLRGPSGFNRLGQEFMYGSPIAAQVDSSREVTAEVQVRPKGGSDLDWRPWGKSARLRASGTSLADIHWDGGISVQPAVDEDDQRLVLTEYELFETDESTAECWVKRPPGGVGEADSKPAARRLVFATDFSL
ncbi:hypothetical protein [Mycobacterium antarcticum]|uniref:hypothetical protein n=1 Tax=Mycolicibacterium sp. TUM20984 TaxID=3023368 RepID=UPI0023881191|nr:hypothetical protein [Mycolicibacterium sp. TUM20984]GLP80575.1 hypothetical protein TUM20984_19950 [Mycolicibacterium sp. TUM20984]